MRDRFLQIKKLVIEAVLWAENELKNKTGAEKKQAVIEKVLAALGSMLPWYVRWGASFVSVDMLSGLVDTAVRSLNFVTGWNFGDTQLAESDICKLAMIIDVPLGYYSEHGRMGRPILASCPRVDDYERERLAYEGSFE